MRACFSASLAARIAYEAGWSSKTNSDSPGSTIEPSLFRLTRNACWASTPVMIREARTCGRVAEAALTPSADRTAPPAARTASVVPCSSR
jgi:hypothetical protein